MIRLLDVVDTMIPGDPNLGMPKASDTNIESYLLRHNVGSEFTKLVALLDSLCSEQEKIEFGELNLNERMNLLNRCKAANPILFSEVVRHLLGCYYTNSQVLNKIGAGNSPPFPGGNVLQSNHWDILEPVIRNAGTMRIVRRTNDEDSV